MKIYFYLWIFAPSAFSRAFISCQSINNNNILTVMPNRFDSSIKTMSKICFFYLKKKRNQIDEFEYWTMCWMCSQARNLLGNQVSYIVAKGWCLFMLAYNYVDLKGIPLQSSKEKGRKERMQWPRVVWLLFAKLIFALSEWKGEMWTMEHRNFFLFAI